MFCRVEKMPNAVYALLSYKTGDDQLVFQVADIGQM
jgi:hypothetical protein